MNIPCPKGVCPQRWAEMSATAKRRALNERSKGLPGETAPVQPINSRPDTVIAKAKEFGLRPTELDAYDLIEAAAKDGRVMPPQERITDCLQNHSSDPKRVMYNVLGRLERAGLVKVRDPLNGVTKVEVTEAGVATWIVPRGGRRRKDAA